MDSGLHRGDHNQGLSLKPCVTSVSWGPRGWSSQKIRHLCGQHATAGSCDMFIKLFWLCYRAIKHLCGQHATAGSCDTFINLFCLCYRANEKLLTNPTYNVFPDNGTRISEIPLRSDACPIMETKSSRSKRNQNNWECRRLRMDMGSLIAVLVWSCCSPDIGSMRCRLNGKTDGSRRMRRHEVPS